MLALEVILNYSEEEKRQLKKNQRGGKTINS
jgi:hypothetical protein